MLAYIKRIITFSLIASFLLLTVGLLKTAEAQVHNRPSSNIDLAPAPTSPGDNFEYYSDPTTITISATADTGYTVDAIYYKLDGGAQQEYTAPISVTGTGNHGIEYWSVDNTGLAETTHKFRSFIIEPYSAQVTSITQNSTTINLSLTFTNFSNYTAPLYSQDCYNDNGASFKLYNADTGAVVSSQSGYSHCGGASDGSNNWLGFPPLQLSTGNYFVYYHGGNGDNWITNNFSYIEPVPVHEEPVSSVGLSPSPAIPGDGLNIYSDPITLTISSTADTGYSIDTIYYKLDGGSQQIYTSPITVTGTGSHGIEYWAVDNTGLEESPHKFKSMIVDPKNAVINDIVQGSVTVTANVTFDDFAEYQYPFYSHDCYNDNNAAFEIYNALTGEKISYQNGYSHCLGLVDPSYAILIFPPLQLPYGTYFIHYHGGDGSEWVSNSFEYIPNEAPTADAGAPQTVFEGDSIQFDASGSSDPDGASDITSYSWEFGDGETGTGINPTHVYKDNGTYTATLTVEDTYGEKDIDNVVISVNNAAPVVGAISASQAYFILGNPTTINTAGSFTDAGILDIHSALWDFGEGISLGNVTESNGNGTATGTFVYTVPGTYTVSLTVTDNDGDSGISQNSLTVSVVTSEGAVNDLLDVIEGFNLHNGIQNSLDGKLEAAQNALDDLNVNNDQAAINSLNAFINTVEQKRGDELTDAEADYLIAAAQAIIDSITS